MRAFWSLTLIALCAPVWGSDYPTYLSQVKGVVLESLLDRQTFELNPGQLKRCDRKVVVDWVIYDCSASGVSASVKSGDRVQTFDFEKVKVWFKYTKENDIGFYTEYHFDGYWRQSIDSVPLSSPVKIVLWHPRKAPDLIRGSISLEEYGLSRAVQATPVK